MPFDLWLAFVAASTALLLIPGPTVLLVLSYALSKGRSVAVASAAGVAVGDLVAMTASLAGLGALVLASATAFTLLKWAGAAYLVWLGLKLIRSAPANGLTPARDVTANGCLWARRHGYGAEPEIHRVFYRLRAAVHPAGRTASATICDPDRHLRHTGCSECIGLMRCSPTVCGASSHGHPF